MDYPILGSFDNGEVQILDIVEDYDHNLWMGNFTGALKFNPQDGISIRRKVRCRQFRLTWIHL